jgi:hypothetical protein
MESLRTSTHALHFSKPLVYVCARNVEVAQWGGRKSLISSRFREDTTNRDEETAQQRQIKEHRNERNKEIAEKLRLDMIGSLSERDVTCTENMEDNFLPLLAIQSRRRCLFSDTQFRDLTMSGYENCGVTLPLSLSTTAPLLLLL